MSEAYVATTIADLYERPSFDSPLTSQMVFGTPVRRGRQEGDFVSVRQRDGYSGWVYAPYLAPGAPPRVTHLLVAPSAALLAGAWGDAGGASDPGERPSPEVKGHLAGGTGVELIRTQGQWAEVRAGQIGWLPRTLLRAPADMPVSLEERRANLAADAGVMIGVPYRWGGVSGFGIDCSGLVQLLHRWIGVEVPRDADLQCAAAVPVEPPYQPGDLLFFGETGRRRPPAVTHVAASLGGSRVIHSCRARNGVYKDDLYQAPYLKDRMLAAGSFLRQGGGV